MPFGPPPPAGPLVVFTFHWQSCPCHGETVSGDGLFLEEGRDDGQALLLLVDVMGHGPAASLVVEHLRDALLSQQAAENHSPGRLLTLLNSWLAPVWNENQTFVAAQAFLLCAQGEVVGSTAGLPAPRHRVIGPACASWDVPGAFLLGPVDGTVYDEGPLLLQPGEGLLACTDGVTEAGVPQFGTLLDGFLLVDPLGPGVVGRLFATLQQHAGTGWPTDDTTAFWIERGTNPGKIAFGASVSSPVGTSTGGTP